MNFVHFSLSSSTFLVRFILFPKIWIHDFFANIYFRNSVCTCYRCLCYILLPLIVAEMLIFLSLRAIVFLTTPATTPSSFPSTPSFSLLLSSFSSSSLSSSFPSPFHIFSSIISPFNVSYSRGTGFKQKGDFSIFTVVKGLNLCEPVWLMVSLHSITVV